MVCQTEICCARRGVRYAIAVRKYNRFYSKYLDVFKCLIAKASTIRCGKTPNTITAIMIAKKIFFGGDFGARQDGLPAVRHAIIVCAQAEKQCPEICLVAAETSYWAFDDPTALEGSPELQRAEVQRVRDEIDDRMARRCAASTPSTRRSARTARTRAQP